MVLPDTSVWVDFSRRGMAGEAAALRELLDGGEVATCGPVSAELLAGAEGEVAERMRQTLSSLPWAELDPVGWQEVGAAARILRGSGQVLPLTDVAIAVAAARGSCALWSFDADFERIAPLLDGLDLYRPG
ncbi:MAG TPA: PIN domain-containing protein [Solirubrobacterales bacterium]|jgi:predicted nucleic acid-binding protein|nr:PIN domain-containing protein [Solirubrobacterales bacterium]